MKFSPGHGQTLETHPPMVNYCTCLVQHLRDLFVHMAAVSMVDLCSCTIYATSKASHHAQLMLMHLPID